MASMAKPPARQENTECQPPVISERHVPSDFPWQKLLLAIKHIVNTTTSFDFPKKKSNHISLDIFLLFCRLHQSHLICTTTR